MGREEKDEEEIVIPQPPPPSPAASKRTTRPAKSSSAHKLRTLTSRSPGAQRKPLPVNTKYDLELREYTQYEIDHPECDSEQIVEQRVIWSKPQKAQSLTVIEMPHVSGNGGRLQSGIGLPCTSNSHFMLQ